MLAQDSYKYIIVVPCYNEKQRWNIEAWEKKLSLSHVLWLFVNDGSTDETSHTLHSLPFKNVKVIDLPENRGKGEAVRLGLLEALQIDTSIPVGFMDADNAYPVESLLQTLQIYESLHRYTFTEESFDTIWTSRMKLAGRNIERQSHRHIVGRIISFLLRAKYRNLPHDTQAGLKLFENTPHLYRVLMEPFSTRWFFEIEIYQRWFKNTGQEIRIWEEPVINWVDVAGSKIHGKETFRILKELYGILKVRKY